MTQDKEEQDSHLTPASGDTASKTLQQLQRVFHSEEGQIPAAKLEACFGYVSINVTICLLWINFPRRLQTYHSRVERCELPSHWPRALCRDHAAGPSAAERYSVELRSLCFFEDLDPQNPALELWGGGAMRSMVGEGCWEVESWRIWI